MKRNKLIAVLLLLLLVAVSFFKDEITPDYRNTPHAGFLSPQYLATSRAATLFSHTGFWLLAATYSLCFIVLPVLIIRFAFNNRQLTRFTLWLHIGLVAMLYAAVFLNSTTVDMIFVSKVNRYLHSPIITLFLWAAFTIGRTKEHE
jgi:FtsH-binding integral membrane protein